MRIAHIIIAHKNPSQLERLIQSLQHSDADFYIHIDKKVDITPFEYLEEMNQTYLIKDRLICNWGGFSIVETIVRSVNAVLSSGNTYDFVNLISAQDYPIQSAQEIHDFFSTRLGQSFLSFDPTNDTVWWKEAAMRYEQFHFTDLDFKFKYFAQKVVNLIMPKRKIPVILGSLYGGTKSTWWTISIEAATYLSGFFKTKDAAELIRFLKLTWGSDEFVIATILMNSPYRDTIVNENYRYIDWSAGGGHPKLLQQDDFDRIVASKMLFARKFDITVDAGILDNLDLNIKNKMPLHDH